MRTDEWLGTADIASRCGVETHEVIDALSKLGLVGHGSFPSPLALRHQLAYEESDYASTQAMWHVDVLVLLEALGLNAGEQERDFSGTSLFDDDEEELPAIARAAARAARPEQGRVEEGSSDTSRQSASSAIPGADRYGFSQVIATDGACSGNPGPGGWAWVDEMTGEHGCGGQARTTNNIMELTAMLEAFKHADPNQDLLIRSDSQYVINVVTKWAPGWRRKGWKKADGKPVANRELVEELLNAYEARTAPTKIDWVRGHDGDAGNERADQLAVSERDRWA